MLEISGNYRGIVTSDEHVPFHDPKALALVNRVAKWWKPNLWLLNGDQLDCYDLSTFIKNPDVGVGFQAEIDLWHREVVGPQMASVPEAEFIKIDGNHEERYPRYIAKSEGIKDLRAVQLESVMELEKLGIRYAPRGVILNDRLLVTHGDFALKWAANSARAQLEDVRYRYNVIIGHAHRQGQVMVRVGDDWSIGQENPCLCSLDPEYVTEPDWSLGFTLFLSSPKRTHTIPVHIYPDYSCYVGDRLFT